MKLHRVVASACAALPLIAGLSLAAAPSAMAASKCTGSSGYWSCYSTIGSPIQKTSVLKSYTITNGLSTSKSFSCSFSESTTVSSTSSQTTTASIKAGLFEVAELSVSGSQQYTLAYSSTQMATLAISGSIPAYTTYICEKTYGYYTVPTRYTKYNNYVATNRDGSTTVPVSFGIRIRKG